MRSNQRTASRKPAPAVTKAATAASVPPDFPFAAEGRFVAPSAAMIALGERAPEPEPAPVEEAEPYRPRFVERAEAARREHDGEPANR